MKLLLYYIKIAIPLVLLFYFFNSNIKALVVSLLIYVFFYRNYIDSARLKDLGLIKKVSLNPFTNFSNRLIFFKELYFKF